MKSSQFVRALIGLLFIIPLESMEKSHQVMIMSDDSLKNIKLDLNNTRLNHSSGVSNNPVSSSNMLELTRGTTIQPVTQIIESELLPDNVNHPIQMSCTLVSLSQAPRRALHSNSHESLADSRITHERSSSQTPLRLSLDSSGSSSSSMSYEYLEAVPATAMDVEKKTVLDAKRKEEIKPRASFYDYMQIGQSIRQENHLGGLRYVLPQIDRQRQAEFWADPSQHKVPQNIIDVQIAHASMQDLLHHLVRGENHEVHVLINEFPLGNHMPKDEKQAIEEFLDRIQYVIYETSDPLLGQLKQSSKIDIGKVANIVDSYENWCKYSKSFCNWPFPLVLIFDKNISAGLSKVKRVEDYGWGARINRTLNSADHYEFKHAIEGNLFNIKLLKIEDCARRGDFKQVDVIADQIGLDTTSHAFKVHIGKHIRREVDKTIAALGNQVSQEAMYFTAVLVQNIQSHQERVDFIIANITKDSPLYREFFHESGVCKLVSTHIALSAHAQEQLKGVIGQADAANERVLLNKFVSLKTYDAQVRSAAQVGIDFVAESFRFGSYDKDLSRVYSNNARHVYNECTASKVRLGLILKHFKDHYAAVNQAKIEHLLLNVIDQLGTYSEQYPNSDSMAIVDNALGLCLEAEILNRQGKSYESHQIIQEVAKLIEPIQELDFLSLLRTTHLDEIIVPLGIERMVHDQTRSDLAQIRQGRRPAAGQNVADLTHKSLDVLRNQYDQRAQQKLSIDVKEKILIRRALMDRKMSQTDSSSPETVLPALKNQLIAELNELAYLTQSVDMKTDYPQSATLIEERGALARHHIESGDILLGLAQVDDCWAQYELVKNQQDLKRDLSNKSHLALRSMKEVVLTKAAEELLQSRDVIGMFKRIDEERLSQEQRSLSHLVKQLVNDTAHVSSLSRIPKEGRELAVSEALVCAIAAQELIDQGHLSKPAQLLDIGFAILEKHSEYSKIFGKSVYQRVVEIATHPLDFAKEQVVGLAHLADLALRGLHFAQRLTSPNPLSFYDTYKAWRQAGELGISVQDASRQLVGRCRSMTAYEWDAQIKSIMAHGGRLTVDLVAADFLFTGVGEGSAVFKSRVEQAIRSIPPEQLDKLAQSLGKTRVIWDKAAEAFALERSAVPALAGEAGAFEGLSLAEQEAAELVLQAESTKKASGLPAQSSGTIATGREAVLKVNNMKEFFQTPFGKTLEGKIVKLKNRSIWKVIKGTNHPFLEKGDLFYLDKLHYDHIEVFSHAQEAKFVLNLDGSINQAKTAIAVAKGRTISI